mmetsp:Transcript_32609/g.98384  ORF Transcript_32609/g.98384 Transcript_32609/m.98384 type:complete len:246 (+) Transcript_32609:526-1263(+)
MVKFKRLKALRCVGLGPRGDVVQRHRLHPLDIFLALCRISLVLVQKHAVRGRAAVPPDRLSQPCHVFGWKPQRPANQAHTLYGVLRHVGHRHLMVHVELHLPALAKVVCVHAHVPLVTEQQGERHVAVVRHVVVVLPDVDHVDVPSVLCRAKDAAVANVFEAVRVVPPGPTPDRAQHLVVQFRERDGPRHHEAAIHRSFPRVRRFGGVWVLYHWPNHGGIHPQQLCHCCLHCRGLQFCAFASLEH